VRDDVPKRLDTVYQKMVAKRPEQRQKSMTEVVAELKQCGYSKAPAPAKPARPAQAPSETLDLPAKTVPSARPAGQSGALPETVRHKPSVQTVEQGKRELRQKEGLQEAIQAADRDYRRRHGIGFLNALRAKLGTAVNVIITLALLAALLVGGYFGYKVVWQNPQLVKRCETQILISVNRRLAERRLDRISSVDFTNTTQFGSVPDVLSFEAPVAHTTRRGPQPAGNVSGQFDRTSGRLELNLEVFEGVDEIGVVFQMQPVP
jgi:hypothetical protein